MEKEIKDIQGEFETERQDYLESIRKQERKIVLLSQIADKISTTLKKDCNYSDIDSIKEQALWLEETQKYKLPEMVTHRTKLPTPGRLVDIQTAPARLNSFTEDEKSGRKLDVDTIIENYFPPRKRANELLNQSTKLDTAQVFNTWRGQKSVTEFTKRNKARSTDHLNTIIVSSPNRHRGGLPRSLNGLNSLWLNGTSKLPYESNMKKPLQLEALPNINQAKNGTISSFEII